MGDGKWADLIDEDRDADDNEDDAVLVVDNDRQLLFVLFNLYLLGFRLVLGLLALFVVRCLLVVGLCRWLRC